MDKTNLSTIELAELLNVSTGRIRQIALSLGLDRKGRDWLFSAEQIEQITAHTRSAPPPPRKRKNAKAVK